MIKHNLRRLLPARLNGIAGRHHPLRRCGRRLTFGVNLVLCASLIAGCAGTTEFANPPRVTLADLRLTEAGLMEQRYAARLRVQNPNAASLDVRGMEYTIYLNGRKFADGVSSRGFSVPGYGEAMVDVNLTTTMLRMFEQIRRLNEDESMVFRYRIAGTIGLAGLRGSLPFSHEDVLDLSPGAGG